MQALPGAALLYQTTPADLAADADVLAIHGEYYFDVSTYPFLVEPFRRASAIPSDWFTRAADRGGERAIIAEAGRNSDPDVATLNGSCNAALPPTRPRPRPTSTCCSRPPRSTGSSSSPGGRTGT